MRVAVCADPPYEVPLQERADEIAQNLSIPKTRLGNPGCDLLLAVTQERLELRVLQGEQDLVGGNPVYADLAAIDTTSPAGRKIDMPLLRAVGIKKGKSHRPSVVDATAGLGEDAWLLASHGCVVFAMERQPVIRVLLEDAINRAKEISSTERQLSVIACDAIEKFQRTLPFDAIVLDPMFPQGRKAKERKPMRVLRMLAGEDADAPELLESALSTGVHRVCVKRPLHAEPIDYLIKPKPDIVYKGKAVRYDVYLNNKKTIPWDGLEK